MWRIWFVMYNKKGEMVAAGVLGNKYLRKGNAIRKAQKQFDNGNFQNVYYKWYVSKTNPWSDLLCQE